ncbi:MAG: rhamnogalacturonan acetylesterase [Eubacteriales bacterium]|nr:rhamnogalacturonan acetylesterase [Eubacteriales bacterium]
MAVIYWAADSTVKQNTILTYPQTGIGQVFHRFLSPEHRVENHAENGRSTKSFLDEGRLALIYDRITAMDFLFIQFGHNDEKAADPARYTDPDGEFKDNLERFVNAARNKNALPVLITPLTRRLYRDPKAEFSHERYLPAMKETAARLNVPLIDLCAMSEALVDTLGEDAKALYLHVPANIHPHFPEGKADNTHLSPLGALVFGGLIAKGLSELGGEYRALLSEGVPEFVNEHYDQWAATLCKEKYHG